MVDRQNAGGTGSAERPGRSDRSLHLDVANNLSGLAAAMEALEAFLERHEIDPEASFSARLTLEEIVTNVIKYGHADGEAHEIAFEVRIAPERVELEFTDDGREFNPLEAKRPDPDLPIEERPVGGLGIHLVREISERLEYERRDDRNALIVHISRKRG